MTNGRPIVRALPFPWASPWIFLRLPKPLTIDEHPPNIVKSCCSGDNFKSLATNL